MFKRPTNKLHPQLAEFMELYNEAQEPMPTEQLLLKLDDLIWQIDVALKHWHSGIKLSKEWAIHKKNR